MARKLGKKSKGEPLDARYGTAIVRIRWPYLALENLEVTAEFQGNKMQLQVTSIDLVTGAEFVDNSKMEH